MYKIYITSICGRASVYQHSILLVFIGEAGDSDDLPPSHRSLARSIKRTLYAD